MTTVLETCRVAPPPGAVAEQSVPLTFFDMTWLHFHPMLQLLFYELPCSKSLFLQTIVPKLKQSLSLTLKHFFPLSGNLIYPLSSEKMPEFQYRSGDSVPLIISESSHDFDDFVSSTNQPHSAHKLYSYTPQLPPIVEESDRKTFQVLAVQVTLFEGRGVCIGLAIHHSVSDAPSFIRFMKGWASISKFGGDEEFMIKKGELPLFNRSLVKYPPKLDEFYWRNAQKVPLQSRHPSLPTNRVRAIYVFTQPEISKLKRFIQAKVPSLVHISSFVAIAAYIWSGVAKSLRGNEEEDVVDDDDDDDLAFFLIPIDLRPRLEPPVPGNYFGNCLSYALPRVRRRELVGDEGVFVAAAAMAAEIKKRTSDKQILESMENSSSEIRGALQKSYFSVAGSSTMDLYGADFGWGKARRQEILSIDGEKYAMTLCVSRDSKMESGLRCRSDLEILSAKFYIPTYILVEDGRAERLPDVPECPVLVFINSKSGCHQGADLLTTCRSILNKNQVFDLGEEAPAMVLRRVFLNIQRLKENGDQFAPKLEKKLRIVVAGGDGTAAWLLGVVSDLKLPQQPPIATVPLGTENNLPFAFGWGKRNPDTDHKSLMAFLDEVRKATEMEMDSWHIMLRMKARTDRGCEPIALPHSLHAISPTDDLNVEGYDTFQGGFWNYFSMGMDAQISYSYHTERKLNPDKFKLQMVTQSTYALLGCAQGWFCAPLVHSSSRNISQICKVKVMKKHGNWQEISIPSSIRSIICVNIPSFSGGLNPWGIPNPRRRRDREFTPPYEDDGLLEVVGFKDAWHGLVLLAPKGHGTRLAQAHGIRFEFKKGGAEESYMRVDGEPWKQPLPVDDNDSVVVEISHFGKVKMLATSDRKAASVQDPSFPMVNDEDRDSDTDSEKEEEEWRKFGAAESLKIANDVGTS